MDSHIVKIGIGQFSSVHLDLEKSLHKLETIFKEAANKSVSLLVMGETWLSGYPSWLDHCPDVAQWNNESLKEVYSQFYDNSIAVDSKEFQKLSGLCREYKTNICIGVNEKVEQGPGNGTVYNSIFFIDDVGILQNHHRKLMPTFTEKLLYGTGDGVGLKSVETSFGRISSSICWEHWMPLTRQALHDSGEHIHIALWPTVHEMHQIASRHYAFEGRCFVIAAGQMMKASDFPNELKKPDYLITNPDKWILNGGSCVIGPDGKYILDPVFDKEDLIICELNTREVIKERMTLDTSGHYQRRDVFSFEVNRKRF
jgi:nitrilase